MEDSRFDVLLDVAITVVLLISGYVVGKRRELKHLRELDRKESEFLAMPAVPMAHIAGAERPERIALVEGSVVVSIDYFKRVLSAVLQIFGGRIDAYEVVLRRARREAVVRMKEDARSRGLDAVVCVRLETSRIASSGSGGKGTAGLEVLAFGTGVSLDGVHQPTVSRSAPHGLQQGQVL